MNFVKKNFTNRALKLLACLGWIAINLVFGMAISFCYFHFIVDEQPYTSSDIILCGLVCGTAIYGLTFLFGFIKSIKAGSLEVAKSETKEGNPLGHYQTFYFGYSPYVANCIGIAYQSDELHKSQQYHWCEIKFYETLANRRLWNTFCPFIETKTLTIDEIDDIIRTSPNDK